MVDDLDSNPGPWCQMRPPCQWNHKSFRLAFDNSAIWLTQSKNPL